MQSQQSEFTLKMESFCLFRILGRIPNCKCSIHTWKFSIYSHHIDFNLLYLIYLYLFVSPSCSFLIIQNLWRWSWKQNAGPSLLGFERVERNGREPKMENAQAFEWSHMVDIWFTNNSWAPNTQTRAGIERIPVSETMMTRNSGPAKQGNDGDERQQDKSGDSSRNQMEINRHLLRPYWICNLIGSCPHGGKQTWAFLWEPD